MDNEIDWEIIIGYAIDTAVALALLLFVFLGLYFIDYLSKTIKKRLLKLNLSGLKLFEIELINTGKQELLITTGITLLQLFFSIVFLYISLVVILGHIPATESTAVQLVDLIFFPLKSLFQGFVDYLPDLFKIVVTIVAARYLIKGVKYISSGVMQGDFHFPGFDKRTAETTGGIINALLYILTIIVVLPSMPGYESTAFKGIATFLGALITIGGSSVIANYMAGIVLTYMHAFDKGDWVEIDGESGQIVDSSSFAITLRSYKKEDIRIPNSKVLGSAIKNFSSGESDPIVLHTEVSIGYDVPWKVVEALLIEAATLSSHLEESRAPFVLKKKLDDFYIVYELNASLKDPSLMPKAYSQIHENILNVFNKEGIEIMSPHFRAERDGSNSTIPSS